MVEVLELWRGTGSMRGIGRLPFSSLWMTGCMTQQSSTLRNESEDPRFKWTDVRKEVCIYVRKVQMTG